MMFVAVVLVFTLFLPCSVFLVSGAPSQPERQQGEPAPSGEPSAPQGGTATPGEEQITVWYADENRQATVPLESYLEGVILAEMPVSFEEEALKAQAVAARTYILYKTRIRNGQVDPASPHPTADVCTDYTHCKAYKDPKLAEKEWGDQAEERLLKIQSAIEQTAGEVLVYEDQPINAVFHAISSGKTENASDIWGGNLPYLVSADSSGDRDAPGYYTTVEVEKKEFQKKLKDAGATDFPEDLQAWLGEAQRSEGGAVLSMTLCGKEFRGGELRKLFDLRSQNFEVEWQEEKAVFHVLGYGHGVGMSQYGANAMAKEGKTYREILANYYAGTTITQDGKYFT